MSFFFQRNKSLRICEMPFGREIWLRPVKCLRAWVDLFHFTFCASRKFYNADRRYFTSEGYFTEKACRLAGFFYSSASSQMVFSGQSVVSKWVRMAREKYSSFSHRAGASA